MGGQGRAWEGMGGQGRAREGRAAKSNEEQSHVQHENHFFYKVRSQ